MFHRKFNYKKELALMVLFMLNFGLSLVFAQEKLMFINSKKGQMIFANYGDQLSIKYKGYLGQTEYFKSTLLEIKDSSFIIGMPMMKFGASNANQDVNVKEIKYADVLEFRRTGVGKLLLKTGLSLTATVGTILLLKELYGQNNVSDLGKIGISLGVGLSLNALINLAIPDKPNHKMSDGWELRPIKD